jgi:hypothetical protein
VKKWIVVLSALLVLQLALAIGLNLTGEDYGTFEPQEKLLGVDEPAVDGLRIEDGESSVALHRRDGRWVLPEEGDFPADQGAVERLLGQLAALEKSWPVATTSSAAKRFEVAEDTFERKLTLLVGEEPAAVLYVGTSPGFRKVHARPAGEDAVYAVTLDTWEASARPDDWIDKGTLGLEAAEVSRVALPGVVLERQGEGWRVAGLAEGEETDAQEAAALVSKLASLRVQSLLGSEAKPEYRQDEPALEVEVTRKDGGVLAYRFSKPEDETYYVLKRSDSDRFFGVAEFTVKPLLEAKREKLVKTAGAAKAGPEAEAGGWTPAEADEGTAEAAPR